MGRRSDENLWVILNYEIQMYLGSRLIQHIAFQSGRLISPELYKTLLQCTAIEEKALHTRILMVIFLEDGQGGDLKISDLIPAWVADNSTLQHNLKNAYDTDVVLEDGSRRSPRSCLNKYLAHPDTRRRDHFDWKPVIARMDPCLHQVFRTLPTANLQALVLLGGN